MTDALHGRNESAPSARLRSGWCCADRYLAAKVRVLIVTHMWPTASRPEHGVFVRDQVEALERLPGVEVEVRRFEPGALSYPRGAARLLGAARRGGSDLAPGGGSDLAPGEGFDVVHAHYGLSGWSALAARGRVLVVTFHGTDLSHRVAGPLSRLLARMIALPATVSAALARERLPGAGSRRRVAVLPCGVDMERFRPLDRGDSRARLGLEPDPPYLLFPADPARAIKRHDRAQALAERLGAGLLALRGVPPAEVPLWVNAANAVVVPSEREGFGLAVVEALACDVPVLATPTGIAPLLLEGLPGALCAPFDLDRWASAAHAHLERRDPRLAGRSRAQLFSSARMAERVLEAYRALGA